MLAHPGVNCYLEDLKFITHELLEQGIQGIECFHTNNSVSVSKYCLDFCEHNKLVSRVVPIAMETM